METTTKTRTFIDEIASVPGGENIRLCMQCGTCTASCPNADKMQHVPSQLIAMARADMRDEVLRSNSMWYCLSCYMCTVRCPRGVKITEMMHSLAHLAVQSNKVSSKTYTPVMDSVFNHCANTGSLSEVRFMAGYFMKTNPLGALKMLPVALNLVKRGRISLGERKLSPEGAKQLKAILQKADTLGGTK